MKRLVFVILTVAAPCAWSAATQCSLGGLTRSVEVVYANPPAQAPCEVIYAKPDEGATRTSLWNAQTESGYCEARAAGFVEKLQGLGWSCSSAAPAEAAQDAAAAPAGEG